MAMSQDEKRAFEHLVRTLKDCGTSISEVARNTKVIADTMKLDKNISARDLLGESNPRLIQYIDQDNSGEEKQSDSVSGSIPVEITSCHPSTKAKARIIQEGDHFQIVIDILEARWLHKKFLEDMFSEDDLPMKMIVEFVESEKGE